MFWLFVSLLPQTAQDFFDPGGECQYSGQIPMTRTDALRSRFPSRPTEAARGFIARRFRIDTRSLAAFRIFAGVLILVDILLRIRSFDFFYTDLGVLPVETAWNLVPSNAFSVFLLSGDPIFTAALFVIHFLVAIQLILGYRTRFAIVVSFLFVVSLDYRNPMVTSYADVIFRHMLFWAMFMPLGARYSIDALRADGERPRTYTGLAGAFALVQMISMYFVNGNQKLPWTDDWLNGNSMVATLNYDSVAFFLASYVREFPFFLQVSGVTWFTLMLGSPVLLVLAGRARYLLAIPYAMGHLFLSVTVRIGAFPFTAILGLMLFFQGAAWRDGRRIASWLDVPIERYYAAGVRFGERVDRRLPRIDRAVRSARERGAEIRRRELGSELTARLPGREALGMTVRVAVAFIVVVSGVFMVIPNLQTIGAIDDERAVPLQDEVEDTQSAFRLTQPPWNFYAGPITTDEYYVFAAETTGGTQVDAYNDRSLQWDRAYGSEQHRQFETYRHRFFMSSVVRRGESDRDRGVTEGYATYLCENYEFDGEEIRSIDMYAIDERTDIGNVTDYRSYDRNAVFLDSFGCGDVEHDEPITPPPEYEPVVGL